MIAAKSAFSRFSTSSLGVEMAALIATPSVQMSVEGGGGRVERRVREGVPRRRIQRSLTHPTPSTNASIPSRYQTFFYATTENKGFNCQASRFPSQLDMNDHPGPGSYSTSAGALKTHTTSFSKKGMGGFASKTRRFSKERRQNLGPGSYDPQVPDSQHDFNRAGVSSNFQRPIAVHSEVPSENSPAPNTYNLSGVHTGTSHLISAQAAFKSRSKRDALPLHMASNPAPGQYSVKDSLLYHSTQSHCAVFNSRSKREGLGRTQQGPGPADYTPVPLSSSGGNTGPKQLPYYRQKHYLCISAPAMPLAPLPPSPGPGHYEMREGEEGERRLVTGAVFLSTTSRWGGDSGRRGPGPGTYDPLFPAKRSYLYNVQQRWI